MFRYDFIEFIEFFMYSILFCFTGVCVMPPAVTIILEYCTYGSLFDFIHKSKNNAYNNIKSNNNSQNNSISEATTTSNPIQMISDISRGTSFGFGMNPNNLHSNNNSDVRKSWNIYEGSDSGSVVGLDDLHGRSFDLSKSFGSNSNAISNSFQRSITLQNLDKSNNGINMNTTNNSNLNNNSIFNNKSYNLNDNNSNSNIHLNFSQNIRTSNETIDTNNHSMLPKESITTTARKRLNELIRSGLSFGGTKHNLTDSLPPITRLSLLQRFHMMIDSINAIEYLHSKKYMHCDVKSLNFLVCDVSIIL